MRYGSALLQTIIPVLEANNRGRGAAVDDAAAEGSDGEDEDEDNDEVDAVVGEGGRKSTDTAVVGGLAATAQDSWLQQGIFGEEAHSGPSNNSSDWQVLYFAVFAFEKLESNCPALLRESPAAPLTRLMCGATALLHSHPWVRNALRLCNGCSGQNLWSLLRLHEVPFLTALSGESCSCKGLGRLLRKQGNLS